MSFSSVESIAFTVFNYPLSFVELVATFFGLVSVFLASRSNVLTWPTGILNECSLFILFFQVQLYADMFLQAFFLVVTLYGWYYWGKHEAQKDTVVLSQKAFLKLLVLLVFSTIFMGSIVAQLHNFLPMLFQKQAASANPYTGFCSGSFRFHLKGHPWGSSSRIL